MLKVTYSLADQNFHTTKSVGIFNVSTRLLQHLARDPRIERLTLLSNSTLRGQIPPADRVQAQEHNTAISGRLQRLLWDQWGVYRAAEQIGDEWLFLPKGFASFLRACPAKLAVYSHDTILESYYSSRPGISRLELHYFRRALRASLKQSRLIFTNSDFTAGELRSTSERWGIRTPMIVNVGIGFDAVSPSDQEPANSVMVLASNQRHKRTDLALDYLQRWQHETDFSGLVHWVGRLPDNLHPPERKNWRYASRLPESAYREVLQNSRALVFFSEYEGFGMPPVEAALAGVCPVYSELESTREVMAGAGFMFRNESYESFARALNGALTVARPQRLAWRTLLSRRFEWGAVSNRVVEAMLGG